MADCIFFVWGGIFADPEFRTLEPGTEECHGPFHDEAQANRAWSEAMRRNIDIAQHRLFVLSVPRPGVPS
jgi:hypothetical protein